MLDIRSNDSTIELFEGEGEGGGLWQINKYAIHVVYYRIGEIDWQVGEI